MGAKPEDAKATVEIIGANDLSKNDGKVIINVKAENGNIFITIKKFFNFFSEIVLLINNYIFIIKIN